MEIPEQIEKFCMAKKVIMNLEQLSGVIESAIGKICDEIGVEYNPDSSTTKKIIKDAIIRATSEANLISEMACDKKTYRQNALNLAWQIIENWCLCYYCVMLSPQNINYRHWKTELIAHLNGIKRLSLKKGCEDKQKILSKLWIEDYDLNIPEKIESVIEGKFLKEGIKDKTVISFVANAFSEKLETLIELLVDPIDNLDSYMERMFPDF